MGTLAAAVWMCIACAGDGPIDLPDGTRVERWYIPASEQARFLPSGQIVHVRTRKEFEDLIARRMAASKQQPRSPVRGKILARFDPASGRMTGAAEFEFYNAERAVISPWSGIASDLRLAGNAADASLLAWGRADSGGLTAWLKRAPVASDKSERSPWAQLQFAWELPGKRIASGWRFELSMPRLAVGSLALEPRAGWTVRTNLPAAGARGTHSPPFGGAGSDTANKKGSQEARNALAFEIGGVETALIDWNADDPLRTATTPFVQSRREYVIDPLRLQQNVEFQFESTVEPIERVDFVMSGNSTPREFQSNATIDWRAESVPTPLGGERLTRWIGFVKQPKPGGLRVAWSSDLGVPRSGRFTIPTIYAENCHNRGDSLNFLLHPGFGLADVDWAGFEPTAGAGNDDGRFTFGLIGFADRAANVGRLPSLQLKSADAWIEAAQDLTFDLTGAVGRLTSRVQWRCQDGRADRLTMELPPGWELERFDLRSRDRQASARIEPEADRNTLVLELDRPLEPGQSVAATIRLEQFSGVWAPIRAGVFDFPIPRVGQSRTGGTVAAACYLSDRWSVRVDGVQNAKETLLPYLERLPPTLVPGLTFSIAATNPAPRMLIDPARTEYEVESRQPLTLHASGCRCEWSAQVRPVRGSLERLVVWATRPLPDDAVFEIVDDAGKASPIEAAAADGPRASEEGRTYELRFDSALSLPARLRGRWNLKGLKSEPPLLAFPEAKRWSARCDVAAASGMTFEVEQVGLTSDTPDAESPNAQWAARFNRAHRGLKLALSAAVADAAPPSPARARVRSRLYGNDATHEFEIEFRLAQEQPLRLAIAADEVVSCRIDGRAASWRSAPDGIESVERLAKGLHRLRLIAREPLQSAWGVLRLRRSVPLKGFVFAECPWTVELDRNAWPARLRSGFVGDHRAVDSFNAVGERQRFDFQTAALERTPTLDVWMVRDGDFRWLEWTLAAAAFFASWRWIAIRRSSRGALGLTLAAWFIFSFAGSPVAEIAGWMAFGALTGWMLRRIGGMPGTTALALCCLGWSDAAAQMPTAPGTGPRSHRVLMPFDPRAQEKLPDQAIIPDALLRNLESAIAEAERPKFLLQDGACEGSIEGEKAIWRLRFTGDLILPPAAAANRPDTARDLVFEFGAAVVRELQVDGKPQLLRRNGEDTAIRMRIDATGRVRFDFALETTVERRGKWTGCELTVPPMERLRLSFDPKAGIELDEDACTPGLTWNSVDRRIEGTLAPTRRLRLGYYDESPEAPGIQPVVRSWQLADLQITSMEWTGLFLVSPAAGAVRRLQIGLPEELVVRRADCPMMRWWKRSRSNKATPVAPATTLDIELSAGQKDPFLVRLGGQFLARTAIGSEFEFPVASLLDATEESTWIGVRASANRTIRELPGPGFDPVNPADFAREWEKQSGGALDRLLSARERRNSGSHARYRVERAAEGFTVSQTIDAQIDPASNRAEVVLSATIAPGSSRELFEARLALPEGFQLLRVDGETVRQWFVADRDLVCLRDASLASEWSIRLFGWFERSAPGDRADPIAWDFTAFDWRDGRSISSAWTIRPTRGVRLDLSLPRMLGSTRLEGGQWIVGSTSRGHRFRIAATAEPPSALARSITEIERLEDRFRVVGRIEITGLPSNGDALIVAASFAEDRLKWAGSAPPERVGPDRWRLAPLDKTGILRLDWIWEGPPGVATPIRIPRLSILGVDAADHWIVAGAGLDPADIAEFSGVKDGILPAGYMNWRPPITGRPADLAWRITAPDWRFLVAVAPERNPKPAKLAEIARVRMRQTGQAAFEAIFEWRMESYSAMMAELRLPKGMRLGDAMLDGRPVEPFVIDSDRVRFQLPLKSTPVQLLIAGTLRVAAASRTRIDFPAVALIDSEHAATEVASPVRFHVGLDTRSGWRLVGSESLEESDRAEWLAAFAPDGPAAAMLVSDLQIQAGSWQLGESSSPSIALRKSGVQWTDAVDSRTVFTTLTFLLAALALLQRRTAEFDWLWASAIAGFIVCAALTAFNGTIDLPTMALGSLAIFWRQSQRTVNLDGPPADAAPTGETTVARLPA